MSCLCCENCDQWALSVTGGAIYWTIKHWSLNKIVGVMFIKLWYIIIIIIINNYIYEKILEIFRKIISGNFPKFSGKIWNFPGKFFRPTSLSLTSGICLVDPSAAELSRRRRKKLRRLAEFVGDLQLDNCSPNCGLLQFCTIH